MKKTTPRARGARISYLEVALEEAHELATAAERAGDYGPAATARKLAADLRLELDNLRAYLRDRRRKRSPLDEVRALRARADMGGSFVAARDLMRLELELLETAKAEEEARRREALEHLDGAAIEAMLVGHLRALPPEVRDRVLASAVAIAH